MTAVSGSYAANPMSACSARTGGGSTGTTHSAIPTTPRKGVAMTIGALGEGGLCGWVYVSALTLLL